MIKCNYASNEFLGNEYKIFFTKILLKTIKDINQKYNLIMVFPKVNIEKYF